MNTLFNKIKKYISILVVASAMVFSACESFLDVQPTNALIADNAIYDAKTSRAAVIAAYTSLKSYSIGNAIVLAIIPGDNIFFGGSQSQNIELDNLAFSVTNPTILSAYGANYTIINQANWVISEVPKVTDPLFTEGEQDNIVGEAYFIRAAAYFTLARSWGGVQIQTNPTTDLSSLGSIKRSSQAETYAHIISDLTEAERLLKPDDATTRNRAQKAVVQALRAKVHLYAGQWAEAENYATQVINNTKYELVKPYSAFFAGPFLTKESVFEFSATTSNGGVSLNIWYPSAEKSGGSYEYRPTNEIVELLNTPSKAGGRSVLIKESGNANWYSVLYHTVSTVGTVPANTDPGYFIRIAELYLIRAEARVRKASPDFAGAIADLNAIRDRADANLFPAGSTDVTAILQAIWDERRLEFAFEADRWYDLVRTEQAEIVLGVNKNYWLFPIPQADVLSDPDLNGENNPGY
jgi:hypothetical protein